MSEEGQHGGDDKQHLPTQQRLQRSREQGDVPYSMEVTAAATYGAFYLVLLLAGGWTVARIASILSAFFRRPEDIGAALLSPHANGYLFALTLQLFTAVAPVFTALAVAAAASLIAQRAVVFAPSKIKLKLSRLSVIDNAKQKYGAQGLFDFAKNIVKLSAIIAILFFGLKDRFVALPELAALPFHAFQAVMMREAGFFLGLVTFSAVAIAAIDLPWRYFQHQKRLMMSHEEMKKEMKENEGDPAMKGARRERAQAIATNRMMSDVPTASVVIVNPHHYAVALKWDRESGAAPACVAKGVDELAAKIRELAAAAGVPIRRDPPTARSLHALVEVGAEIKKEHYAAVAAAIHYADEIQRKAGLRTSP